MCGRTLLRDPTLLGHMDLSGDAARGLKMRAPGNELGPVGGAAVAEAMANCTQLTSVVLYRMYCVPVLLLLWCVCLCVWLEFRAQDCGLVVLVRPYCTMAGC